MFFYRCVFIGVIDVAFYFCFLMCGIWLLCCLLFIACAVYYQSGLFNWYIFYAPDVADYYRYCWSLVLMRFTVDIHVCCFNVIVVTFYFCVLMCGIWLLCYLLFIACVVYYEGGLFNCYISYAPDVADYYRYCRSLVLTGFTVDIHVCCFIFINKKKKE